MSTNYRDLVQYPTTPEEDTTSSSSSSGDESQVILGILSSPSSTYLIHSFVGQGTFGKVAKCTKSATKETVAVKIISDTYKTEAYNEAAILKQLRAFDPDRYNFVRHYDDFTDSGLFCLEFEMLDMNLLDFLEKKPCRCFSVKEIRPILQQMATALQFLGSLGLVHTDLKPNNIMIVDHVNQPLKVKMIDFGVARHVSEMRSGVKMQALVYRSPEVILGHPCTAAIDMWSLGCIAAELFLGYILYPGRSEYDMLRRIVQTQGQLPLTLLDNSSRTRTFFCSGRCQRRRWRLKTPLEYGRVTREEKSKFNSLDDLKKIRPVCHLSEEDNMAEVEDLDNFIDLLKKMLYLDPSKRMTPSLLLEDPFITMSDLSESFPDSFYMKSACEMMEVCRDQSSDDMTQDPWLDPQASTSTATQDQHYTPSQVAPAWHNHQEHPLVLGAASAVSSSLSIRDDQSPPQLQQLSCSAPEEKALPEQQLPTTSVAPSNTGKVSPVRKRKRSLSERSPESCPTAKRIKTDFTETRAELHETSKEAPAEASSSTATAKPQRKRTWATFVASHTGLRTPFSGSPERKKRKMAEAPSNVKPQRKRTWATFVASNTFNPCRTPYTGSPERKKMKMAEAPSNVKPQRKRTWATFVASNTFNPCRTLYTGSPERKRMKMNVMDQLREVQTEAPSTEAKIKPQRKRTWATFVASNTFNPCRTLYTGSPERKRMKMNVMDQLREVQTEAPSTEAKIKPQRKRTWATFVASNTFNPCRTPYTGSPERKRMKMNVMDQLREVQTEASSTEAKIKPQRKRTWATFVASYAGLRTPHTGSPERKKMKMTHQVSSSEKHHDSHRASSSEKHHDSHRASSSEKHHDSHRASSSEKHHDSHQASSNEAKSPQINDKNPDCSSPKRKKSRKSKTYPPVTVAQTRPLRKRKAPD